MKKMNLYALLIASLLLASPAVHADSDVASAVGGMNKKAENMAKREAKKAEREAKKAERKAKYEAKKAKRDAKKAEKASETATAVAVS